MKGIRL